MLFDSNLNMVCFLDGLLFDGLLFGYYLANDSKLTRGTFLEK